eukprot:6814294-Prymnesium_polylepis.2
MVAMFNDSYAAVKHDANTLLHYQKYREIAFLRDQVHPLPPPFCMPVAMIQLGRSFVRKMRSVDWPGMCRRRTFRVMQLRGYHTRLWREKTRPRNDIRRENETRANTVQYSTELFGIPGMKNLPDKILKSGLFAVLDALTERGKGAPAKAVPPRVNSCRSNYSSVRETDQKPGADSAASAAHSLDLDIRNRVRGSEVLEKAQLLNKVLHKNVVRRTKADFQSIESEMGAVSERLSEMQHELITRLEMMDARFKSIEDRLPYGGGVTLDTQMPTPRQTMTPTEDRTSSREPHRSTFHSLCAPAADDAWRGVSTLVSTSDRATPRENAISAASVRSSSGEDVRSRSSSAWVV